MVREVVKAKVGELEDEVREVFSRWLGKELTVLVESFSGKMRLLVRCQYECEKVLT